MKKENWSGLEQMLNQTLKRVIEREEAKQVVDETLEPKLTIAEQMDDDSDDRLVEFINNEN